MSTAAATVDGVEPVSDEERRRREDDVARGRHSTIMEGGRIFQDAEADQDSFARGEIDEAEMVRRFRERYQLDDD